MNPCMNPQPPQSSLADGNRWLDIHNRFVCETKEREPDVVILGDSLTSQLEQRRVWKEDFVPLHTLNFSIIGDQIQQVLWRVLNGELENIKPKVIVVYVGEQNLRNVAPELAIDGIVLLVNTIKKKQAQAQIFVQELLPRGRNPNSMRDSIDKFNTLLRQSFQDKSLCSVVPVGDGIIKADGTISHLDLYDYYYPTDVGYKKAFAPLKTCLNSVLCLENVQD